MFRTMRRSKQQLSQQDAIAILMEGTAGVLALAGDEGYPYAVPVSYVYQDNRIYVHSGIEGHKVESIRRNDKASFCVIEQDLVVPEELTTYYRSVIAFGRIHVLSEEREKRAALEIIGERFHPGHSEVYRASIERSWDRTSAIVLDIEHLTGKVSKELVEKPSSEG